ncbi:thioesterase II family protein [Micromonospora cathayae]|uniref:Alpha/beta fold hydrolase n=1 Tax=Micromonospora cathayae TaxID=3028804 RepID=A0ABY7ZLF2_9ACTN|nr:alpha/beta fold hydrolase [Micromonospora sp. HUAS 3]WDZ83825.1 alpha/beta fold hydrolase [Micromonospora sp. HUAS 3]
MRLFCLPHAGGSAGTYRRLLGNRVAGVRVTALEPAGRGTRSHEPPYRTMRDTADDLGDRAADVLAADDQDGYALLGHSLGALLALEVAHRLTRLGRPAPRLLVVSGRNPPHLAPEATDLHRTDLSDEDLFARLVAIGGATARASGPLIYRTFMPVLRADLVLAGSYRAPAGRHPLDCPLLVLYGRGDPLTSVAALRQWRDYTSGPYRFRSLSGGHFFPMERPGDFAAVVEEGCAALPGRRIR